jgi:AcrR family transcriptional regulator
LRSFENAKMPCVSNWRDRQLETRLDLTPLIAESARGQSCRGAITDSVERGAQGTGKSRIFLTVDRKNARKKMDSVHQQGGVGTRRRPAALSRGRVAEIQRSRMLSAALATVEEVGYGRMTVAQVIGRARVSRKTFYDVFADREDCFLAALEQAITHVGQLVQGAYEGEEAWRDGVRAGLAELLAFLDEEPALARIILVEALGAGPRVLEHRAKVLHAIAKVVDRGRFATSSVREPPEVVAEGVVGAVLAVLHTRALEEPDSERFSSLFGSLMNIVALPYLGARAASRELIRAAPKRRQDGAVRRRSHTHDPMAGLTMRLTYRTVRVLVVIAEHPGASNREIAERSGVSDQGQISKLLARLARLELIHNTGEGQEKGGANAWQLTVRGSRVERATRSP